MPLAALTSHRGKKSAVAVVGSFISPSFRGQEHRLKMPRTQNLRAEPDRVEGWREGWLPVMVHFTVTFTGPEGAQPLGLTAL